MPTSLIYIVLSTRGCSPWRPAAVMSTTGRENKIPSLGFSRTVEGAPDPTDVSSSSSRETLAPGNPKFQGTPTVKKKRELFPGPPLASPSSIALPPVHPHPGAGILTCFPFDRRANNRAALKRSFPIS